MAREWDSTVGEYLGTPDIPDQSGATAWTIAGWFIHDSQAGGVDEFFYKATDAGSTDFMQLFWLNGSTAYRTRWDIAGTGRLVDAPAADITVGEWTHYACRFTGSVMTVFINGVSSGTPITGLSGGLDNVLGFAFGSDVGAKPIDGKMAEWAMWNRALANNEIVSLANYRPPSRLAPNELYIPILGTSTEPDWSGQSFAISVNGTPAVFDHVPIGPSFGFDDLSRSAVIPVVAGGLSIPVAMNSYRQRHQSVF
ncbi:hypothetical protein LCGC14_2243400 [marine sediment metagenome]|uniref:LamG-like jellyroll fold domain-containing protein n=1 Tax=marine sediment metagenome TaxID=412755 RepID=A0A0F9D4X2_9ZZZZ